MFLVNCDWVIKGYMIKGFYWYWIVFEIFFFFVIIVILEKKVKNIEYMFIWYICIYCIFLNVWFVNSFNIREVEV